MNPQLHDEFIALCALFFAGELSDEEWALLQVHLAYCEPCRKTFEEYQQIDQVAVPAMAASAAAESGRETANARFSLENAEKRLMKDLGPLLGPDFLSRFVPAAVVTVRCGTSGKLWPARLHWKWNESLG